MTGALFADTVRRLNKAMRYSDMARDSDDARSQAWWNNLANYGAWGGPSGVRVGPPPPEAIPGIARLFNETEDRVREMIAADWYGVNQPEIGPELLRFKPLLERLTEDDLERLEDLARRLGQDQPRELSRERPKVRPMKRGPVKPVKST